MSKKMKRSVDFEPVEYSEIPEVVAETEQEQGVEVPEAVETSKKSLATRLLGVLLLVLSVIPFFLAIGVIKGEAVESMTMLDAVSKVFGDANAATLFGALPVYADTATAGGVLAGLAFYVFLATLAIAAISGVLTAICASKCTLKTAIVSFAFGSGAYALSLILVAAAMDVIALALMAVGALFFIVLAFKKCGKKAALGLLLLILSVLVFVLCALGIKNNADAWASFTEMLGMEAKTLTLIVVLLASVFVAYDAFRALTKNGFKLDLVRYILSIVVYAAVLVAGILSNVTTFLISSAISFVLVAIIMPLVAKRQKKEKCVCEAEEIPEIEEEPEPEFVVEEYAEAMPYDGGPVEGVEIAQEVNPTFEDTSIPTTPVITAGYDFYNCKSFDPFIAILNNEERNQFTELFILKFKGVMPEIPDYQVGGDNKEFFRKIFIYLGQYRDRIPDGLLAKMYQFNIKMQ